MLDIPESTRREVPPTVRSATSSWPREPTIAVAARTSAAASSREASTSSRSDVMAAVVVCTKDRSERARKICANIAQVRRDALICVIDASQDSSTEEVCRDVRTYFPALDLQWFRAERPGLARQRNQGLAVCRQLGIAIVHFLDDDAEILPGYFDAIEGRFAQDVQLGGVGGAIQNQRPERHERFNRVFLLSGLYPYTVLKSGRVVNPQPPAGAARKPGVRPVQWLQGFAMSYRVEALDEYAFDERLSGYSFGEDKDLSFRLSRSRRLAVEAEAKCLHHRATENRLDAERFGFESTVLLYAWVREHRNDGLSLAAFWWALFGDILRHVVASAIRAEGRAGAPWPYVRGVVRGIGQLRRGNLYEAVADGVTGARKGDVFEMGVRERRTKRSCS